MLGENRDDSPPGNVEFMVLKPEEWNQFAKGVLRLHCPEMEIAKSDGTESFRGSGYIEQTAGDDFSITLFQTGPLTLATKLGELFSLKLPPGAIVQRRDYYSLCAKDIGGREWRSNGIIWPTRLGTDSAPGHIIRAECAHISGSKAVSSKGNWVQLDCLTEFPVPANVPTSSVKTVGNRTIQESYSLKAAKFDHSGYVFELYEDDNGHMVLTASPHDQSVTLHPQLESRIAEAIIFALGIRAPWQTTRIESQLATTVLRGKYWPPIVRPSLCPLAYSPPDGGGSVWALFGKYFDYIMMDTSTEIHPLSRSVINVVASSDGYVNDQVFSIAFAVESVLGAFFKDAVVRTDEFSSEIDNAIKHMETWGGNESIRRRAIGSIKMIGTSRQQDRLSVLVEKGLVSVENCKAWIALRNPVAHGDWSGLDDVQHFVDKIDAARVLFYQLIFHLIGYSGKHTNWGARGYPLIDYPPIPVK